jgi:hypothetical protein
MTTYKARIHDTRTYDVLRTETVEAENGSQAREIVEARLGPDEQVGNIDVKQTRGPRRPRVAEPGRGRLTQVYIRDGKPAYHGYLVNLNPKEVEACERAFNRTKAAADGEDWAIQDFLRALIHDALDRRREDWR